MQPLGTCEALNFLPQAKNNDDEGVPQPYSTSELVPSHAQAPLVKTICLLLIYES